MGTILFLPASARRNRKREFREVLLRGTKGRPLTQRLLPGTLQEFDNNSCPAKIQILLVGSAGEIFISLRSFFVSRRKRRKRRNFIGFAFLNFCLRFGSSQQVTWKLLGGWFRV